MAQTLETPLRDRTADAILTTGDRLRLQVIADAKILVVDDEPDIVEEVVEQLEYEGLRCASASSARAALDLVRADPEIGVVVTDIRMPGMDGLDMANQMKKDLGQDRDLFVIVVTGHAGMKEAIDALKIGAEDFLTKPISPDHLLHSVRRAEEMIQLRRTEREFKERLKIEVAEKTKELTELNQKLAAANGIKDQFLSTMGHELRTPLNAINGFGEMLRIQLHDKATTAIREYIDFILQSGKRLESTIENILEFSSTLAGSRKVVKERMVIKDLFDSVISAQKTVADARAIDLRQDDVDDNMVVDVDGAMIGKALCCVVSNAIKFSDAGTTVTLRAVQNDDETIMHIVDQGRGMSKDEIEIARKPLSQVNGGLARTEEGIGIGLSLAILLVEMNGGRVEIASRTGKGTDVAFHLPNIK